MLPVNVLSCIGPKLNLYVIGLKSHLLSINNLHYLVVLGDFCHGFLALLKFTSAHFQLVLHPRDVGQDMEKAKAWIQQCLPIKQVSIMFMFVVKEKVGILFHQNMAQDKMLICKISLKEGLTSLDSEVLKIARG